MESKFVIGMGMFAILFAFIFFFNFFEIVIYNILHNAAQTAKGNVSLEALSFFNSFTHLYSIVARVVYFLLFAGPGIIGGLLVGKKFKKQTLGMEVGLSCSLVFTTLLLSYGNSNFTFQAFMLVIFLNCCTLGTAFLLRKGVRKGAAVVFSAIYHR